MKNSTGDKMITSHGKHHDEKEFNAEEEQQKIEADYRLKHEGEQE